MRGPGRCEGDKHVTKAKRGKRKEERGRQLLVCNACVLRLRAWLHGNTGSSFPVSRQCPALLPRLSSPERAASLGTHSFLQIGLPPPPDCSVLAPFFSPLFSVFSFVFFLYFISSSSIFSHFASFLPNPHPITPFCLNSLTAHHLLFVPRPVSQAPLTPNANVFARCQYVSCVFLHVLARSLFLLICPHLSCLAMSGPACRSVGPILAALSARPRR